MSRDFNGTNEEISFGSDTSIDGFTSFTVALWLQRDTTASTHLFVQKNEDNIEGFFFVGTDTNILTLVQYFSGDDGTWNSTTAVGTGLRHVAFSYDRSSTTNDPMIYLDAASDSITEVQAPTGSSASDAANDLIVGEIRGVLDLDGRIGWLIYHDSILTAADINRHRWWGCAPGGPSTVKVWQPMWTSDLNNRGTATANGTATGTTVAAMPRVERCWGSMMGCGR